MSSNSDRTSRSYAIYRLPHADCCTLVEQTDGQPLQLSALTELNSQQGFVGPPFCASHEEPILLIRPDKTEQWAISHAEAPASPAGAPRFLPPLSAQPSASYSADFQRFHQALLEGRFQKLVLARCASIPLGDNALSPIALFQLACQRYPRLFIALVSTPQSGTWLTATPEILLEGSGTEWHTVALAGTMRLRDDELDGEGQHLRWSTKNIQEQRYVASYIADTLKPFAKDIHEEGPRTVRAANLVHLRSDFSFTLAHHTHIGHLLAALHPTPAVCGLPKDEALNFITRHEHAPRHYYSGFMGPMAMEGGTHLYMSLRCMQMAGEACHLYAGGGLLRDSTEQKAWQETEAKMETMRTLFVP